MPQHVIVFDLETIPDLEAVSRVHGLQEHSDEAAEELVGDKFPKLPLHKIACIGAVIAERLEDHWAIRSIGAPHIGDRSEADLITAFSDRLLQLRPTLVSYNGQGFDLPVLRYRAMASAIPAPGLCARPYYKRYDDAAVDLCDVLGSYTSGAKAKLDELCRVLGLAGKPEGVDGGEVAGYVKAGRIADVAAYCETDVVNTYRVWLRYELFRGTLKADEFQRSEVALRGFIGARLSEKPHLAYMLDDADTAVAQPPVHAKGD